MHLQRCPHLEAGGGELLEEALRGLNPWEPVHKGSGGKMWVRGPERQKVSRVKAGKGTVRAEKLGGLRWREQA